MLSSEMLRDALDALPYPDEDKRELEEALETIPLEHGLRATFTLPLEKLMEALDDERRGRWEASRGRLPKYPPFSYLPIRQLVVMLAQAAAILFPELPLYEGPNRVFEEYVSRMHEHTTTKNITEASGGDLFKYLEVVTSSTELWYNFGQRSSSRVSEHVIRMHYDGWYSQLSEYWVPGLNRGLLKLFEQEGTVEFRALDKDRFEIDITRFP